jgi:O-succinylbenzoic acid--CoA ligase
VRGAHPGDLAVHGVLRYWSVPELVALDLPGGVGFVDALRAIWDTGDAAAPLDPRLPGVARRAMLDALRPTRIVASDGEQHPLPDGRPAEEGDALVVTTSGTSGQPKGVVLTHEAVAASAHATSARLGVDPARHSWLACLPLAHIGGLSVVTRAVITGTPLLVLPGFEADTVEAVGRTRRASHVALVATALRRVDPSVFSCVLLGGSKAPEVLPPNVVSTYGMTETGSGVVYNGVALDGVELALRPSEGTAAGGTAGATAGQGDHSGGEILVRAPMLFRCYRDGTDGRVAGPDGATDWFATGDAGHLGADGTLTVSGRIDDVITTGAEKVWPDLVERALVAHPGVAEVAVWKRSDPEWGERVVAWVVPGDDAPSLDELRAIVAEAIAPWAAPKELVIVDDLPRTAAGKVRRRALETYRP